MKYINNLKDGERVREIYFCRQRTSAVTKNGKPYLSLLLQDKTGVMDAKIWNPNSPGISEFESMDYIEIHGEVKSFNGQMQISIEQVRKVSEGEYSPQEYLPCTTKNIDEMYMKLMNMVAKVENRYLNALLNKLFADEDFANEFKKHSAAKSVHHSFIGGLLEHTLSVTQLCYFYTMQYPVLNKDLLITAAICHDIGKIKEISSFPVNDYTDEGQLIGHIVMGTLMVDKVAKEIEGFPEKLLNELKHCILAHHGEYEYGSPKKPALAEAVALNFADNTDAKMETMTELLEGNTTEEWLGFNRLFESNIRKTSKGE